MDRRRGDLRRSFDRVVRRLGSDVASRMSREALLGEVMLEVAPCLYLSVDRGVEIVRGYLRGGVGYLDSFKSAVAHDRAVYLVMEVMPLLALGMVVEDAVCRVVSCEAPSYYVSCDTIRRII